MSNIAWNILELKKKTCLKFKSNWASCILSDKPTDGQMQKKKKKERKKVWLEPLPLVGHTETENKKNTNNKPKGRYIGYLHRTTSQ